jgi:hypothetical protein
MSSEARVFQFGLFQSSAPLATLDVRAKVGRGQAGDFVKDVVSLFQGCFPLEVLGRHQVKGRFVCPLFAASAGLAKLAKDKLQLPCGKIRKFVFGVPKRGGALWTSGHRFTIKSVDNISRALEYVSKRLLKAPPSNDVPPSITTQHAELSTALQERLSQLGALEAGWCGAGGRAPGSRCVALVKNSLEHLLYLLEKRIGEAEEPDDIGATPEGEIELIWSKLGVRCVLSAEGANIERRALDYASLPVRGIQSNNVPTIAEELFAALEDAINDLAEYPVDDVDASLQALRIEEKLKKRLLEFRELKDGWIGPSSRPPAVREIHFAAELLKGIGDKVAFKPLGTPYVGAAELGEVEISWPKRGLFCELRPDGIAACCLHGGPDEEEVDHRGSTKKVLDVLTNILQST